MSGHGDAHNGNVFYLADREPPSLLYFDPAFAGKHDPLLDLTKPLFHNVFAMWMYHAQEKADALTINVRKDGDRWDVTHDYGLPPVRSMFWQSKVQRVLAAGADASEAARRVTPGLACLSQGSALLLPVPDDRIWPTPPDFRPRSACSACAWRWKWAPKARVNAVCSTAPSMKLSGHSPKHSAGQGTPR